MDAWNTIQVPLPMRFPGRKYSGTESLLNIMACAAAARGTRCAHTAPQQHGRVGQSPCCKKRFFFWIFYKLKIYLFILEIKWIKLSLRATTEHAKSVQQHAAFEHPCRCGPCKQPCRPTPALSGGWGVGGTLLQHTP